MSSLIVITILVRYASPEHFPLSAHIVIGLTLFTSFAMIGLLAEDLAFTLKNKRDQFLNNQIKLNKMMDKLWLVIYWSSFFLGSFVIPFF